MAYGPSRELTSTLAARKWGSNLAATESIRGPIRRADAEVGASSIRLNSSVLRVGTDVLRA